MQTGNFQTLPRSDTVLFADHTLLVFLYTGNGWLLRQLYETIYVTPDMYSYYAKLLDIEAIKLLQQYVKRFPEEADGSVEAVDGLTVDEAFAAYYCKTHEIDLAIDDPTKAGIITGLGVHVVRLSDMILATATT